MHKVPYDLDEDARRHWLHQAHAAREVVYLGHARRPVQVCVEEEEEANVPGNDIMVSIASPEDGTHSPRDSLHDILLLEVTGGQEAAVNLSERPGKM